MSHPMGHAATMPLPHDRGLSSSAAQELLRKYGENAVATRQHMRPIVAFVRKFNSPLLWIIMIAAAISFVVGERTNAVILIIMVIVSVVLDFVNTYRSERAVKELLARVITKAVVVRDGIRREVPLTTIVPGDLVQVEAGDVIPADGRVVDAKDLYVNQSTLTGESVPVEKEPMDGHADGDPIRAEDPDAVFMGTSVVTGYANVRVLRTGPRTEFGKIAERLQGTEPPTDFERGIRQFSMFIMRVSIVMVAFVFLVNAASHRGWLESFIFAIAIAIGLTPELLPVILTVSLSRGAVRMSRNGVIVKRLPAIQNFGRMNVLCTDKTGTLTENHIAVVRYIDPYGAVSEEVLHTAYLNSVFHTGVANPLDQAIRDYRTWDVTGAEKIDEIPFDFERRRESIAVQVGNKRLLITKGAPEAIFPICSSYELKGVRASADAVFNDKVQQQYLTLSQEGHKVLGVAVRDLAADTTVYEKDAEEGMTFLGFLAFLDPPKVTVLKTIQELEHLGIEVKILTGDSAVLTEKVCRDIRLPFTGVVSGTDLEHLDAIAWRRVVTENTIFARITPEQKEQIILHLQRTGKVVGFLGDGINDAPALKAADVGVSVNNAVDVAKETADIILLRRSLRVLKDGIVEGRRTFENTMKYILMGLSSNFGNMFSMVAASAFLPFLPMLPAQILLNNFLYDSSQLTLSTDSVDPDDVRRPTVWDITFIKKFMVTFGSVSSVFDFITFGVLLSLFRHLPSSFQTGWFIESIATQVFVIYMIRTKKLPFLQSRPSAWLVINTVLAVGVAWSLQLFPLTQHWFSFTPLPIGVLGTILGIVAVYLVLVEIVKHAFYRRLLRQRSGVRTVEGTVTG